ncbi:hypothetical protein ABK040_015972 [Willaertia magna]
MAPVLFNIIGLAIIRRFLKENNLKEGFCENTNDIAVLSYADDFTLMADNYTTLKKYFISIKKIFNKFGLELDPNKSGFVSNSFSKKNNMVIEKNWVINRHKNVEILGYYVFETKTKKDKQEKIVNKIRLLSSFIPLKFIQPYRLNTVVNSKLLSKISYLCRSERFEPMYLERINTAIRSAIKTKAGIDKKLCFEVFYKSYNENGFGLTKSEDIAKNCYMSFFLNYLNHKTKPIRYVFEEAYFNCRNSKEKNFFYEVNKYIKTYSIKQGSCNTRKRQSKIGKFELFNFFTDGSCIKGRAGGGIHIRARRNNRTRIFNRRLELSKGTNNKGEVCSVVYVVKILPKNSIVNFYVDSNMAIGIFTNKKYKGKFELINRTFQKIIRHKNIKVRFHKVKSYTGNKGNDKADQLAKKGIMEEPVDINQFISKSYSYLIKSNNEPNGEKTIEPEPIFNLYTWNKQFKSNAVCNTNSLWLLTNQDPPLNKYRYLAYKNNGLIEYKYGQTICKCFVCNKDRTVKHVLEDCVVIKQQLNSNKDIDVMVKSFNSRGEIDKIKFESYGFKFDFLSHTLAMAANNTRYIGKTEIERKIRAKENNRFKRFLKEYRRNNPTNSQINLKELYNTFIKDYSFYLEKLKTKEN